MMDDIPSLSSGSVGSRFISQADLDEAQGKRDEQWKAAYARLGQEPPERLQEEVYDGRSLAEKLAANKAAAQEEWEQKMKLSNQFRALEEDEVTFLDTIREKQLEEERERQMRDKEEVKNFREAVAARENEISKPPIPMPRKAKPTPPILKTKPPTAKSKLKGVIVKKKHVISDGHSDTTLKLEGDTDQPMAKRRRLDSSGEDSRQESHQV